MTLRSAQQARVARVRERHDVMARTLSHILPWEEVLPLRSTRTRAPPAAFRLVRAMHRTLRDPLGRSKVSSALASAARSSAGVRVSVTQADSSLVCIGRIIDDAPFRRSAR